MTEPDRRTFLQSAAVAAAAFALEAPLPAAPRLAAGQAPIKVGVIGAGRQGKAILTELAKLETAQVTAICDDVPGRLRAGARRLRGVETFDDGAQLIASANVDAVVIATSTHAHKEHALLALAAKKPVYCEAPLAHTLDDSKAIVRAARAAGVVFQAGLLARSDPIYELAWGFHKAGVLATLVALRAQDHQKTSWRFPGDDAATEAALNWRVDAARCAGLPGELGTHQFDVLHWFVGQYPTAVRGRGAVRAHADGRELADTVHCTLRFEGGLDLSWSGTLGSSYEGRYETIAGSMGTMKLGWTAGWLFKEAEAPTQGWEVYANRESFWNDTGITLIADATKLAKQGKLKEGVGLPNPPLYYALADWLASLTGGAPVACTAEEGHRATAVGILAQRAVATGDEVAITQADLQVE